MDRRRWLFLCWKSVRGNRIGCGRHLFSKNWYVAMLGLNNNMTLSHVLQQFFSACSHVRMILCEARWVATRWVPRKSHNVTWINSQLLIRLGRNESDRKRAPFGGATRDNYFYGFHRYPGTTTLAVMRMALIFYGYGNSDILNDDVFLPLYYFLRTQMRFAPTC